MKQRKARFEIYRDAVGLWRFRLKAANGEVVASGEAYHNKKDAKRGARALKRAAAQARIVETERPRPVSWR